MEFVFTGFRQTSNVRQYSFDGIGADRTRTRFIVGALALSVILHSMRNFLCFAAPAGARARVISAHADITEDAMLACKQCHSSQGCSRAKEESAAPPRNHSRGRGMARASVESLSPLTTGGIPQYLGCYDTRSSIRHSRFSSPAN